MSRFANNKPWLKPAPGAKIVFLDDPPSMLPWLPPPEQDSCLLCAAGVPRSYVTYRPAVWFRWQRMRLAWVDGKVRRITTHLDIFDFGAARELEPE